MTPKYLRLLLAAVAIQLSGCASQKFPKVELNAAPAFSIEDYKNRDPHNLISGSYGKPNVPPSVTITLKRTKPLHNREPRYFIPADSTIKVVILSHSARYGINRLLKSWHRFFERSPSSENAKAEFLKAKLREIPFVNAGECFHAKLQRHDFPWGKSVLFLTSYVQGRTGGPVNNDMLILVVQGFTNDWRYAVRAHFSIRHPRLPESLWDKTTKGKVIFDIDEQDDQAEQWLDNQPSDSFQPAIQDYISLLSTLKISR